MEQKNTTNDILKKIRLTAVEILKKYFNAMPDKENEEDTIKRISDRVSFHGATRWDMVVAISIR